ncbi:hypothetical protein G3578_02225 [Brevibacillus sp. SYP-B805]|uniref:hypothetical protein n=1 Tax=Brevibacillus sp. SYP-B805 TaxID=1578199 RepID=UPI0013EC7853|nr:hypothetical protein [Brevibacillus sp. SYP-B805]NGQ93987.1 hypothetical protein [Brevibacillus sp. SYP-B805]
MPISSIVLLLFILAILFLVIGFITRKTAWKIMGMLLLGAFACFTYVVLRALSRM